MASWLAAAITGCIALSTLTGSLAADFKPIVMTEGEWNELVSSDGVKGLQLPKTVCKAASKQIFGRVNVSVAKMQPGAVSTRSSVDGFNIDDGCTRKTKASKGEALGVITRILFQGPPVASRGDPSADTEISASAIIESNVTLNTLVKFTFGQKLQVLGGKTCVPGMTKSVLTNVSFTGQTRVDLKMRISEPRVKGIAPGDRKSVAFDLHPSLVGSTFVWSVMGVTLKKNGTRSCQVSVMGHRYGTICTGLQGILFHNIPPLLNAVPVTEPEILAKLKEWLIAAVGKEVTFPVSVEEKGIVV